MNRRMVFRIISFVLLIEAIAMIPSIILSLVYHEPEATKAFGITILLSISLASLDLLYPPKRNSLYATEGYVITALSWIIISIMGCLPFLFTGTCKNFFDAFFEIVSGFTTTGATILTNIEATYKSLLFWRSFSHWLGGMGVLVFLLAIVSLTGSEGNMIHLLRAESPGYDVGKMTPKLKETAKTLYILYIALTALEFVLLLISGMPAFDSICVTMGTAGTGGFGVTNNGIAAYSSGSQTIITIFMLVFGVNFSIYYLLVTRKFSEVKINEELWTYLGIFAVSSLFIAFNTLSATGNFSTALHHSSFQVASIMTTTGFNTVDFDLWPWFSKTILVILMFIGASAGSTGGGIKVSRAIIAFKAIKRQSNKILHPRSIRVLRMNKKPLDEPIVQGVVIFIVTYIFILFASMLLISFDNFNLETNFTAVISCLSNIGPGLNCVGPTSNFSGFSSFSKAILSLDMLIGRLEIFPMLILLNPRIWRRNSGRV